MKEVHGIRDGVFDDHSSGISVKQRSGGGFHLVGRVGGR